MKSVSNQPRRSLAERLRGSILSTSRTPLSKKDVVGTSSEQTVVGPFNNAKTDVITTLETLPDDSIKWLFRLIYASIFVGFVALMFLFVSKVEHKENLKGNSVLIWNVGMASAGLVLLTFSFIRLSTRIYMAIAKGLRWSGRRCKVTVLFTSELLIQMANLGFYFIPNLYLLIDKCVWRESILVWMGFGRMTCWNTIFLGFLVQSHNTNLVEGKEGQPDCSVFDLPFTYHAPKLLIWLALEGLSLGIAMHAEFEQVEPVSDDISCDVAYVDDCEIDPTMDYLTIGVAVIFFIYFIGSTIFLRIGFNQLSEKQYLHYRMANVQIRLQSRMQMIVHSFHTLSFLLLWFIGMKSCESIRLSWLGFLPTQFVMTVACFVRSFLIIPQKPSQEDQMLEMWLREFAWSEDEIPSFISERGDGNCLKSAPVFCFERAVKTFYWSAFIYDFKQIRDSKLSLETAMHLFNLTEYKIFHEPLHDTKLIVAWNDSLILLTFRGTSSLKNIFADLRFSRTVHPPKRGTCMSRPRVHRGFLETWQSNGLNQRVIDLITSIRKEQKQKVLVTGHSLGGALAILAAYDMKMYCDISPCQIECYTFGAPRVGNYSFACDYGSNVPTTWHVINDQDYITRTMKFLFLYKHPGHRVIINSRGDMLVRPSFIEMTLARTTGAVNILHHFLASYQEALLSIAKSQFNPDGIEGGAEQMLKIANTLRHVLGVSKTRLIQELSWGSRIKARRKKKKSEKKALGRLRNMLAFLVDSVFDVGFCLKCAFQRALNWMKNLTCASRIEKIDPSKTIVSGNETFLVIEMQLPETGDLCTESGHCSLGSRHYRDNSRMLQGASTRTSVHEDNSVIAEVEEDNSQSEN